MLEIYFESPLTLNELRDGPCGAWLDDFAAALQEHGYSWWTGRHYLRAAHHVGHFLESQGQSAPVGVEPSVVVAFRNHLKRCRCPRPNGGVSENTVRGVKCFIRHLQNVGIAAEAVKEPWPPLVEGFRQWLKRHRGASETTIDRYGEAAAELLQEVGDDLAEYDAERLRSFILHRVSKRGVGSTKAILSALRMFLRYLASQCHCRPGLDGAIPAIAGWHLCRAVYQPMRLSSFWLPVSQLR